MLIVGVQLIGLDGIVIARALEPFPIEIRALDAMHLATAAHLQNSGLPITLASYDMRNRAAAQALGIELFAL